MIVTRSALLRLGLLVLLTVVLQISGLSSVRLLGGNADLIPLLVGGVALLAGSLWGAVSGFAAGLLLDIALGHPLGASSLVLTGVGYAVGRYREIRDPAHGLVALPFGAAATLAYVTGIAVVSFMLGVDADVSVVVFREMLVTVLLNLILALPFFALVRRTLRPALVVDPLEVRRRRREPRSTGPIGLRGLEV